MKKEDCFHLGYVAKLHGYKGEVSLFLDVTNPSDYNSLDAFFLDINNQLTPFFVERFKLKNKGFASVKLEGIDSEDAARKLLRKNVYLPDAILPELEGTSFYDHEVVGFKVIDEKHGNIGILNQVIDFKVNPLLQIMKGDDEILVPLIEGTVKHVNREDKELTIISPDGLVDLYLG